MRDALVCNGEGHDQVNESAFARRSVGSGDFGLPAEANAETFTVPGMFSFTAAVSGEYALELLGASGGGSYDGGGVGGRGAEASGDVFLTAGEDLTLFVGGQGASAIDSGGGGGGSFVFHGADVLAVAGGGGGAAGRGAGAGGPGLAGTSGGAGGGFIGGVGGAGGTGGDGGGAGVGGGGAGVNTGPAGYGANGSDFFGEMYYGFGGGGGKFPHGGTVGNGRYVGAGGYGGGGGGAVLGADFGGGGGGSGFSGGGGGEPGYFGGGGGGSYLASLFTDQVLTAGVNSGDGSISIAIVPEASAWAMTLMGFAGLGLLARMRKRKLTPA